MNYRVEASTDGRFIGKTITEKQIKAGIIQLSEDFRIVVERLIRNNPSLIVISTNYQLNLKGA